jgi:AraC-like DNA-binding protein
MLISIEKELTRFLESLPPPDPRLPVDLARALSHIHERLFDPDLNVATLRHACGLKNNAFHGRFRGFVGLTPKCYIEKRRLEAAQTLLSRLPVAPVVDVAVAAGYGTEPHRVADCADPR